MTQYTRFPNGQRPNNRARGTPPDPAPDQTEESTDTPVQKAAKAADIARPKTKAGSQTLLTVFLISLMIPLQFWAGPLLLTPYRLILLVVVLPFFFKWISGKAGKIYKTDLLFLGFVLWIAVTLIVVHGSERLELVAITTVETFGAFLVGRVLVRTPEDYNRLLKFLFICMVLFVPAAALESTTGIRVYSKIADLIGHTHPWVHASPKYEKRLGMFRSQMVFEHPILFGVFASTAFGMLYYTNRDKGGIYGYRRAWMPFAGTFFSLSSGAILSIAAQGGLTFWDKIMKASRARWKILMVLGVLAYVVVDLLSNRTPVEVFISYAAFSAHNGYMRINILNFGMDNVWAHPFFGLGMGDWVRPRWMHAASVDNFWLLMAMRHGFPGFLLIAGAYLGTMIQLGRLKLKNPRVANMRTGYIVSLVGLLFSLMTVHIWGATYVFVCFLLGAAVWMRDYADDEGPQSDGPDAADQDRGAPNRRAAPPNRTQVKR